MDTPITDSPTQEQKRQLWKAIRRERNIEALDTLRNQHFSPEEVIKKGARHGNLPFLKDYLNRLAGGIFHGVQRGDLWTFEERIVQSLRKTQYRPWIQDTSIMKTAIKHGHVSTARYLYDKGFERGDGETFHIAVRNGDLEMVQTFHLSYILVQEGMADASFFGHKHILEWLKEKGGELGPHMCKNALERGHLECAKWIAEHVCLANARSVTCCCEKGSGHIKCLEDMLKTERRTFNKLTDCVATTNLECMRYIEGIGCPLTTGMFHKAVIAWNVPCMEYLHEKKCPWTNDTIIDAVRIGNDECIEWLKSHGYSADTCPGGSQGSL